MAFCLRHPESMARAGLRRRSEGQAGDINDEPAITSRTTDSDKSRWRRLEFLARIYFDPGSFSIDIQAFLGLEI